MNQKIEKGKYPEYKDFAKNHTKSEIMEKFNISSSMVDLMRWKYGFTFQPRRVPTAVFAMDMSKDDFVKYCKTHTLKEIRDYFNVATTSVYSWEKKYNFKIKKTINPTEKAERNAQIIEMSKTCKNEEIAKKFGLTPQRILQIKASFKKRQQNGND